MANDLSLLAATFCRKHPVIRSVIMAANFLDQNTSSDVSCTPLRMEKAEKPREMEGQK